MAEHDNFYQRATYYDIVFDRDVSREVDFIVDLYRHYHGDAPESMLDIACGPGYHAREFARRGLRATGLDLRPEMVEFAREKDAKEGLSIEWLAADMRTFSLIEPVDVAATMFDSLDALTLNADLVRHFQTVAANLTPCGVYLVDLTHPRDLSYTHYRKFEYHGERDGTKVDIFWATNDPCYDVVSGTTYVELEVHVNDHGEKQIIKDSAWERLLYPQELSLIADLSGKLKMVGTYGSYDLGQPLDFSADSDRMLLVFQKLEAA